jgi:hypothetical protein
MTEVDMKTLFLIATAALAATPALAHTGHIADEGYGHSHWLALAILGGLGVVSVGMLVRRVLRSRRDTRTARN